MVVPRFSAMPLRAGKHGIQVNKNSLCALAWLLLGVLFAWPDAYGATFARAEMVGKAHLPSCGAGGFPDLLGQCWQCPEGLAHDNALLTPNDPRVCRAVPLFSAGRRHDKAGLGCPGGQWPSLHNGYCYTCPDGFGHDLLRNGDDARVCFKRQPDEVSFARGNRHGKTVLGLGCPGGQWPSLHNGRCYTCPAGFAHDIARNGDDPQVCFRKVPGSTAFRAGQRHAKSNLGVCPAGQWLSTHDGACYTCPAGHQQDVARTGDDPRVCFQRQDRYSAARRSGGLLCDRGFFDPINGGSCWRCPAPNTLRTVSPVHGDRACTNELAGIVSIDICTPLLGALREGEKGMDTVNRILQPVLSPVLGPVNKSMQQLMGQLRSPAELDKLLDQFGRLLQPFEPYLDEVTRLHTQLSRSGSGVRNLLLDARVMCNGDLREIDRELTALGLRPSPAARRTSWLEHLPLAAAQAQARETAFVVVAFTLAFKPEWSQAGIGLVFSVVTNFQGDGGVFFSAGPSFEPGGGPVAATMAAAGDASISVMLFPATTIDQFGGVQNLGAEIAIDGGAITKRFTRSERTPDQVATAGPAAAASALARPRTGLPVLPKEVVVSFNPNLLTPDIPGLGVSWELASRSSGAKRDSAGFAMSFDFSTPFWVQKR